MTAAPQIHAKLTILDFKVILTSNIYSTFRIKTNIENSSDKTYIKISSDQTYCIMFFFGPMVLAQNMLCDMPECDIDGG